MNDDVGQLIVVQFRVRGSGTQEEYQRRVAMEKLLGRVLKEDGNGSCNGGDRGSNTMNVYLLALDPGRARRRILDALEEAGWLDDVTVALSLKSREDEEAGVGGPDFEVWWPADFRGTFALRGRDVPPDHLAPELARFQGTWKLVRYDPDEETSLPPEQLASTRFVFTGDQLVVLKDGQQSSATRFTAFPYGKPHALDMIPTSGANQGKVSKGIYTFTGDRLWLCSNAPGEDRPVGWKTRGNQAGLMILERVEG
jgi:uncharacterized protein (TIGR03067 family)